VILDTDASDIAVGAILSPTVYGVERPIAFFSRIMNFAQRNYCPTRRELLAVIAGLQHFRHYLVGVTVILRTDHYSLKWLRTFKRPEGILARWIETLAEFDYTVEHRPGRLHSNADGLSRPFCKQYYDRPTHIPWVDEMERADAAVGPWSVRLLEIAPEMADADVAKLQDEDEILGPIKSMLSQGYSPTLDDLRALPLEGRKLWSIGPTIVLQNQVLVRRDGDAVQLVVPQSLRHQLFTHTHAGPLAAHLGSQRMLAQLRRLYYWPGMRKDIDAWCRQCEGYATSRGPPSRPHGHLRKVSAGAPMDLVAIDILSGQPATANGYKYLLVATDYFLNGSQQYLCAMQRHTRPCAHFTVPFLVVLAYLANYTATREATSRVSWWQSSARSLA